MPNKLGRRPRVFNHKIPHMSAMMMGVENPIVLPPSVHWAPDTILDYGMMLNDRLGDCTCAAVYHAIQIWSVNGQKTEITESDNCVLSLYEQACGYNPADPSTDQGGVEQHVLQFLLNNGAPMDNGSQHKILAFYEIDPRHIHDVKQAIYECGLVYIGFEVPQSLMKGEVPALWETQIDQPIIGGHAVILTGYDDQGFDVISWGKKYKMSYEFFSAYTDEAYAIVDPEWIQQTGTTPCGLTASQLEQLMQSLR
jgi:hypothetical protein